MKNVGVRCWRRDSRLGIGGYVLALSGGRLAVGSKGMRDSRSRQVQQVTILVRKTGRGPRRIGLWNPPALHDVLEKEGVIVYSQNVKTLYLLKKQRVGSNVGSQGENKDAALHDVLEIKGVTYESQELFKNVCY